MNQRTINFICLFLLISFIQFSNSLRLKKKFQPLEIGQKLSENEISETLSNLAISKLYERLDIFTSTSCRCTAKFILLAIGGIRVYDSLKNLTLTDNIDSNIELMKEKLNENYIYYKVFKELIHLLIG